jgi:hypothetical protein
VFSGPFLNTDYKNRKAPVRFTNRAPFQADLYVGGTQELNRVCCSQGLRRTYGRKATLGVTALIDLSGKRFGRLTVLHQDGHMGRDVAWMCVCDCGQTKRLRGNHLKRGAVVSCRCFDREKRTKHGLTKQYLGEHKAWVAMIARCTDPLNPGYKDYGGRGIRVCDRWLSSFADFLSDMKPKPSREFTLDRIEVNGDYEIGNCRWATRKVQQNNTRFNHVLTYQGRSMTIAQWSDEVGLPWHVIGQRIARGWSVERAITQPSRFANRQRKET